MEQFKPVKEGKVREIYDLGENLVLVATDRISVFDIILKTPVTKKGVVLCVLAKLMVGRAVFDEGEYVPVSISYPVNPPPAAASSRASPMMLMPPSPP